MVLLFVLLEGFASGAEASRGLTALTHVALAVRQ
jgi:hypothetical protein